MEKNNSLLIVEDDILGLMALRNIFQMDYILYTAKHGDEAIKKALKYMPDLILLEITLPDMGGCEVLAKLKESDETKGIPVIFIKDSGEIQNGGQAKISELEESDYIIKPFNPAVVKSKVKCQIENINFYHELTRTTEAEKQKNLETEFEYMPYGKVLLVDDIKVNLDIEKMIMEFYGIKVDIAESGAEAIEIIRNGNIYDIIFMDHMMPDMDGVETVKIIRKSGYAYPIVALTANVIRSQEKMFMENGFDGFIARPMDRKELDKLLNELIRDKQTPETLEEARRQKKQK